MNDPISSIEWRDAATLQANSYNPNVVFTPELRLLERSILLTGYVQPILITPDGTIIDGFHRARLAQDSPAIKKRYAGQVPCAVIDVTRDKAMILTIRMNRAKGSHVAVRMSEIVRELIDVHSRDPQEVAIEIGATKDEVDLLY
jgi:ParB-like chromosome segregation protein Spo0J